MGGWGVGFVGFRGVRDEGGSCCRWEGFLDVDRWVDEGGEGGVRRVAEVLNSEVLGSGLSVRSPLKEPRECGTIHKIFFISAWQASRLSLYQSTSSSPPLALVEAAAPGALG